MEVLRNPSRKPVSSRRRFWQRIKRFRQSKASSTPSVIGPFDYPQCFPASTTETTIRESPIANDEPRKPSLPLTKDEVMDRTTSSGRKPALPSPSSPQTKHHATGPPTTILYRFLTTILSCNADLPTISQLSCCTPDTTTTNDSSFRYYTSENGGGDEIEVTPSHHVVVSNKELTPRSPGPHIQLGTFESFVSELSWETTNIASPPPMAYYAVSNLNVEEVYPRRCFFSGLKIAKYGLYYAGCVVQGRRTLVVFCHASVLPEGDLDIASRLSTKYSLKRLSNLTVWQSYNAVCHWSGLPIHTERDVHHRWKCGNTCLHLAEVAVDSLSLAELQKLPIKYEAKTPVQVLESLEFWETFDPTTTESSTIML